MSDHPSSPTSEQWTAERRFLFDLKGWVCIPSVLSAAEIDACKAQIDRIKDQPDSIDPLFQSRPGLSGPLQELLDHPVLVDVLRDIIAPDVVEPEHDAEAYGFRVESNFIYRLPYNPDRSGVHAHRGTKSVAGPHVYRYHDGRIYSGQTRAVWELNEVRHGDGGTRFLSGSHKANLPVPESVNSGELSHFETYACPPGSLLLFCERVMHAGATWRNEAWPRMSVFNCYNHYNAQVHKMNISHEMVMAMPPKRRTLFRGVWEWWNNPGGRRANSFYAEDNRII